MSIQLIDHMIHLKLMLTWRKRPRSGGCWAHNKLVRSLALRHCPGPASQGPSGHVPILTATRSARICSALPQIHTTPFLGFLPEIPRVIYTPNRGPERVIA